MCGVVLDVVKKHSIGHTMAHEVGKDCDKDELPER